MNGRREALPELFLGLFFLIRKLLRLWKASRLHFEFHKVQTITAKEFEAEGVELKLF
jgi:hypothetical protein